MHNGLTRPGGYNLPGSPMKTVAAFLLAFVPASLATAETHAPLRSMVVGMAQHFVQEKYMFGSLGHYHIEFDVAYVYPQPQPNYWAVVGGFVSDQNTPNIFVAAVQLICADFAKVKCWHLAKLSINGKLIVDQSEPL